ncbi:uncharacterized protein LOC142776235 [Rhipicephalus microplus]|uniref:uncharacterized protein LOC142776235 n=1 Tax=Rhipicephalus microplus TaxID=6941 RepID=UPI003F6D9A4B
MHLVCLGVMNKLLTLWVRGPKVTRLGSKVRLEMSEKNSQIARCVPCDFSRKPRSIAELDRWKATEFRFFLLYGGPVVLSSLIPAHMYKNFLALHVGISVLSTPAAPASEIEYAGNMLKFFIRTFISIYGKEHVSHNVHGLCHLADDVTHLGPLDSWSAFPFENHMSSLKRMLRKPDLPLEQLCNRLAEQAHRPLRHKKTESHVVFAAEHADGPLVAPCRGPEFKKVTLPGNVILRAEKRNGCCRLSDGSIVVIDNFAHLPCGEPCIIGRKFLKCEDFYSLPCPSSILGTFGAAARRMLELLLSLEVAVQFSWAGQKGKRKFVDLGVTDVICKAVRRNFPETKKNDIECVIKVWLRHAGEKLQKQRLRTSRTHHEECLQSVALSSPSDEDL